MEQPSPLPIDDLSLGALRSLVKELVAKLAEQDAEIKALKDEVTRLKGHKGKPKLKPSGMEQATEKRSRRHGKKKGSRPSRQKLVVNEEQRLTITPPAGSRFNGYQDFVVQELRLEARVIRYRRERWLTAEGKVITAPLPSGLRGHFGPELLWFILLQHHQGQVTVDRIATFLTSLGLVVSKRQILRLLTGDVATFAAEADDVLRTGLSSAPWITVDDTGARHRARNGVTTQIGNDRFTFFGTSFSKSRRNFQELLRAGHRDYVVNAEAVTRSIPYRAFNSLGRM